MLTFRIIRYNFKQMDKKTKLFDKLGIFGSGACVAHCLFIPFLALAAPSFTSFLENEWIHKGLLVGLIPISFLAFSQSKKVHKKSQPIILGVCGIALLILAIALEAIHVEFPYMEQALTTLGSICLITAHIYNMKFSRQVTCAG